MPDFYSLHKKTTANSSEFILNDSLEQAFPVDGLYIGKLFTPTVTMPALWDMNERNALCFLYDSPQSRIKVNTCIERLVWRIAASVPSHLCDLVLFNGGNPGDAFNTQLHINRALFGDRNDKIFFGGNEAEFSKLIDSAYASIINRMSLVKCANKSNLVELNKAKGTEATEKYLFFILTDFPRNLHLSTVSKLSQMIKAGANAGIYVVMSWDMSAKFEEERFSSQPFDPRMLLQEMELLFPKANRYYFQNSGHDDILNRFVFEADAELFAVSDAEKWAAFINKQVEKAKKRAKRAVLKQDFAKVETLPYEPVMSEISVTVGLDIEDKHEVTLRFNSGDYIHAFILGQSGSGKSVLLNNIITTAILKYSPDDLMLYLMDFKGVEFNRYRGVKHTKAVLVDNSDPQMTLEVLRELKEENARRIKLWRKEGVNNIDGYNRKHPDARLPQVLFVADECQVMFQPAKNGTQRIIQSEIADILNIIATQGRSQGIHMLLATQQLDETDISGQVLKNLTECFLLMSAPSDSDRLVPDSSDITSKQPTGLACYFHKKQLQSRVQSFFAKDEELESAILLSQEKASSFEGNGAFYFSGSSVFSLEKKDLTENANADTPVALVGKNIGLSGESTAISLRNDFSENILFFGANKQGQTTGVVLSALASLMYSYQQMDKPCDFLVIDCLQDAKSPHKKLLKTWSEQGLCHLIERTKSGRTFAAIAEDIRNECARPVVLAIIGNERFIEIKRNLPLEKESSEKPEPIAALSSDDMGAIEPISFDLDLPDLDSAGSVANTNNGPKTFQSALTYILEEGPMQGVHILMQVDKPGNILFEGDYGVNATDKFRHKVILKSENKFLMPMRFSQEIDVEALSDEEEHLRAYYYPEGDDPILFTPYQMPDKTILNTK
jgi:hypothetical protein